MIFQFDKAQKSISPLSHSSIVESIGGLEADLEGFLKSSIGDSIFPEYLIFGNERKYQAEADLFGISADGDLILFELKTKGAYDRGKIYQAMDYAQMFSHWRYAEMEAHFHKCFPGLAFPLSELFLRHFGFKLSESDFNRHQKIIIISNASSISTSRVAKYWNRSGIDIREYFYRFFEVSGKLLFELSDDIYTQQDTYNCMINTCSTHFPDAYLELVKKQGVAAWGDKMPVIGEWLKKANIFLYHNGYGIIAAGVGTAHHQDSFNEEYKINERFLKLERFITGVDVGSGEIKKYLSAGEIRKTLGRDLFFATTAVPLSLIESQTLSEACIKLFSQ